MYAWDGASVAKWRPPADEIGGCKALDDPDKSAEKDSCYTFGPIVALSETASIRPCSTSTERSG